MKFTTGNKKLTWVLSGLFAVGLSGTPLLTLTAHARGDNPPGVPDRGDGEWEVKYDDLPKTVKDSLDAERHDHKVSKITYVRRNGDIFYRAIVDEKGAEREIRVGVDGKILTEQDQRGERSGRESVNAGVVQMKFDDCPGKIKGAIGAAAGSSKILSCCRFVRDGQEIYQCDVGNADHPRTIQCDVNGTILEDFDLSAAGASEAKYDELPPDVKRGVDREAHGDKILRIALRTRSRAKAWTAEILDRDGGKRYVTVDPTGKVISEGEVVPRK